MPLAAGQREAPRRFTPPAAARPLEISPEEALELARRDARPTKPASQPRRAAVVQLSFVDESADEPVTQARSTRARSASHRTVQRTSYDEEAWTRRANGAAPAARVGRRETRSPSDMSSVLRDPFGDNEATQSVILAPALTRQEDGPSADEFEPELPDLPQENPRDVPIQPLPPARRPSTEDEDCDRIYNDRNCCNDEELCEQARARILRSPITRVSLDISPRYNPELAEAHDLPPRERRFESIVRDWRNRAGRVVARGTMHDVRHGRIVIRLEGGGTKEIPLRQLSDDDLCFFAAWWGVPNMCTLGDEQYIARNFTPLTMTWKASALCHKPLYFEETQLERYGHTAGPLLQPALSGAHFFLNIATLPYQAGMYPPTECQYPLGYYRPGNCAPWLVPPIPLSVRGGLAQASAVMGGVLLVP